MGWSLALAGWWRVSVSICLASRITYRRVPLRDGQNGGPGSLLCPTFAVTDRGYPIDFKIPEEDSPISGTVGY